MAIVQDKAGEMEDAEFWRGRLDNMQRHFEAHAIDCLDCLAAVGGVG